MYKGDAGKLVIVVLQINSVYCRPNIAKTRGPIYKESLRQSWDYLQTMTKVTTILQQCPFTKNLTINLRQTYDNLKTTNEVSYDN